MTIQRAGGSVWAATARDDALDVRRLVADGRDDEDSWLHRRSNGRRRPGLARSYKVKEHAQEGLAARRRSRGESRNHHARATGASPVLLRLSGPPPRRGRDRPSAPARDRQERAAQAPAPRGPRLRRRPCADPNARLGARAAARLGRGAARGPALDAVFNGAAGEYDERAAAVAIAVDDVNSAATIEHLRSLQPDVVVCLGGPIYREALIEAVPLMVNFHSGISPLYNGTSTIAFAFANGHPHLCGGTLMLMSTAVDGGDILAHYLPSIEPDDDPASLFAKTVRARRSRPTRSSRTSRAAPSSRARRSRRRSSTTAERTGRSTTASACAARCRRRSPRSTCARSAWSPTGTPPTAMTRADGSTRRLPGCWR